VQGACLLRRAESWASPSFHCCAPATDAPLRAVRKQRPVITVVATFKTTVFSPCAPCLRGESLPT